MRQARKGFNLVRIFGVQISVHYSWFLIFLLVLWMLAGQVLPEAHPRAPGISVFVAGLCATLMFFGSVLAHELSHSLVARALGLKVLGITLFVFGGVSTLAQDPDDGWTEIKVAAAGPLMSFFLGATFLGGWMAATTLAGGSTLTSDVLGYLAWANLVLGVFNLVPGFPLDGGRVLRAFWWIATGSVSRATRVAARGGALVAIGMIVLGGLQFLRGNWGGAWIALIGFFLWSAAGAAGRDLELREALRGTTVRQLMTANAIHLPEETSVEEAAAGPFVQRGLDLVEVTRNGQIVGVVTLEGIERIPPGERAHRQLRHAMTPLPELPHVGVDEPVRTALERMSGARREALQVVEGERPAGWITLGSVSRFLRLRRGG